MLMRKLAALVCLITLAACGQPEPAAPAAPLPTDPAAQVRVEMFGSPMAPDWQLIAYQRDCPEVGETGRCPRGEIHFNRATITRSVDGTVANIWAQVTHGSQQVYPVETETEITRIRYTRERVHYRLKCNEETFAIVERQFMGANDTVIHRDNPREIYRAPTRWSAVAALFPPACQGGTLQP